MVSVTRAVTVDVRVDDVVKVVTDPGVVLPIMGSFGRFDFVRRHEHGEEWDLYLNVGTILVGGRVLVESPSRRTLTWQSIRGTHQRARLEVTAAGEGSRISMEMTVEFAGAVTGWLTGQFARGILARNMEAGLQQLRHEIQYGR